MIEIGDRRRVATLLTFLVVVALPNREHFQNLAFGFFRDPRDLQVPLRDMLLDGAPYERSQLSRRQRVQLDAVAPEAPRVSIAVAFGWARWQIELSDMLGQK